MRHERGELVGHGGLRLRTGLWCPSGEAAAVVLLSHGYGEHLGRYAHVIEALVGRGYAVAGLDHRGHGESAGRRTGIRRFDDYVEDLHLLAGQVRERFPVLPRFMLGHSMGGLIATRYALRHQADLAGLILSGAALQIGDDVSPLLRRVGGLISAVAPHLPVVPARRPGILSTDPEVERHFAADPLCYQGRLRARTGHQMMLASVEARARCDALTLPLLVMHGADDTLTNPAGSQLLHDRSRSADKTLKLWPGLRHEIFNEPQREDVIAFMLAWLDEHVPLGTRTA
ncbi:MAG: lysophospholipase [Chloroflexota bacterium]|nr:lysophospholipase [Chloroflexota bacterium]